MALQFTGKKMYRSKTLANSLWYETRGVNNQYFLNSHHAVIVFLSYFVYNQNQMFDGGII